MIRKIINLFFRKKAKQNSFELYRNYLNVHDSAIVMNSNVRFDLKDRIQDRKYVTIGQKALINSKFIFESEKGEVIIGDNVNIGGANFICRNKIEIENDVLMAWDITLYDHNSHSIYWDERSDDNSNCYEDYIRSGENSVVNKNWSKVLDAPIKICSKVWVGFGVTILKGVTIGEGAVIGAKSVITKDVEPWTVVVGNPAKIVKYLPEYYKK